MLRKIFFLFWWEGAFALAYDTWMGPTYLTGLAGELGVPVEWVSWIAAAPWIGSIGQVFGIWALARVRSVRAYTLWVALASRLVWILPIGLAIAWTWRAHQERTEFPVVHWFSILAMTASVAALLGASSAAAWNSWVRGSVPAKIRGRFFGVRQRYVMFTLLLANLIASICVGWKVGEFRAGYLLLGILAVASALVSSLILAQVPDVRSIEVSRRSLRQTLLEPLKNQRFKQALILGATFHGAIQLAGPYFPYFFTHELRLPMSLVAIWTALTSLGCFLFTGWWGRKIDRTPNLGKTLWVTGTLLALSPLPYAFLSAETIRWIAPIEYFWNGAVWAGYSIALTTLLFGSCPDARSAVYFSLYAAAMGVAGLAGNLIGAQIAEWFKPWGGFRALWVIASILRVIAAWRYFHVITRRRLRRKPDFELQVMTSTHGDSGV